MRNTSHIKVIKFILWSQQSNAPDKSENEEHVNNFL